MSSIQKRLIGGIQLHSVYQNNSNLESVFDLLQSNCLNLVLKEFYRL